MHIILNEMKIKKYCMFFIKYMDPWWAELSCCTTIFDTSAAQLIKKVTEMIWQNGFPWYCLLLCSLECLWWSPYYLLFCRVPDVHEVRVRWFCVVLQMLDLVLFKIHWLFFLGWQELLHSTHPFHLLLTRLFNLAIRSFLFFQPFLKQH